MSETTTEPAVDEETELEPDEALEPSAIDEEHETAEELELEPAEAETDDSPSIEEVAKALDREATRHERALAKALGIEPDAMHSCPTCDGMGYTPEPIVEPPALVQDPFTETCPRCRGNGSTLSGATARALEVIPCNGCSGSGYVQKPEHPNAGATLASVPPVAAQAASTPPVSPADAAELAALRAKGYTILEPIVVPGPATG